MVSRGKRNTLSREEARAALERRDTEGRTNALHNEMLKKEKRRGQRRAPSAHSRVS